MDTSTRFDPRPPTRYDPRMKQDPTQALRDTGVRVTRQREALLKVLTEAGNNGYPVWERTMD